MELKPGYQQTEVGVIPEDWEIKEIDQICTPSKVRINPLTTITNHKCIELEHLSQGTGQLLGFADSNQLKSQKAVFRNGDVLFGKLRPYLKKYFFPEFDGVCTTEIWVLHPSPSVVNRWLYFIVQSDRFLDIANQSTGTKMPRAEWSIVRKALIPIPSTKTEQTAIANALGDADALIQSLASLIAKKRQIKQGAMQTLLNPYENGQLKMGWVVKKLSDIFEITAGGDLRKDEFSQTADENHQYPIYSNALTNLGFYGYCKSFDYSGSFITVTARGGVGFAVARNCAFAAIGRLLVLKPINDINCQFVSEYINLWIEFANENTGVPQLTAPQISKYEIAFPSKNSEQTRIATILSDMDAEIAALETKLAKYRHIKQGMMQNLLTGRIRLVQPGSNTGAIA